jgi:hypothetical protein
LDIRTSGEISLYFENICVVFLSKKRKKKAKQTIKSQSPFTQNFNDLNISRITDGAIENYNRVV